MKIEKYSVQNLDCAGCSAKIETEINKLPEVNKAHLDFINKQLTVYYEDEIEHALERINTIAAKIEPGVSFSLAGNMIPEEENKPWFVVLSVFILIPSLYFSGVPAAILGLLAYLVAAHKVIQTAFKELFSRQLFAEHFLMTLATFGAIYLGEYVEAAAVMILFEAGEYLESKAIKRSRGLITSILSLKPETVHLSTEKGIETVPTASVQIGQSILVYPGERVPLDGVVSKGESTVDTSTLTGESEPAAVNPGSLVYAGFLNQHAMLEIKVSSAEAESMISRILNLIENAGAKKSSTEKFITRFARIYTPAVVGAALLVFLIPLLLGYPGAVWFKRALVFLIVSCPCALVISIPLSYFIGIGIAAKRGVIFKGSTYLDVMKRVRTLVFDKTGTLTTGELKVVDYRCATGVEAAELKNALYLCEYASSHPFALALKADISGEYRRDQVQSLNEYPGKGIELRYGADSYLAGSEGFLRSSGLVDFADAGDYSVVHCAKNGKYLGCATFWDELKPNIKESIQELRKMGVKHISMLSGDRPQKAKQVAESLGLDSYYAGLLPEDKLHKLEEIMAVSVDKVAYCGDGLNDAPVLARADVGIAMGNVGAQASIETADVVLLHDKPEQIVAALSISQKTNRLVWQNISIALGIKALVMVTGLAGISGLWEAIIADVGVTLFVIFHSLRTMSKQDKLDK